MVQHVSEVAGLIVCVLVLVCWCLGGVACVLVL